jgi:hypothetical protein
LACFDFGPFQVSILLFLWHANLLLKIMILASGRVVAENGFNADSSGIKVFCWKQLADRAARWCIFKPKVQIWVNFGVSRNEGCC